MNLKELIDDVERLQHDRDTTHNVLERVNIDRQLRGIKQTVEAIDAMDSEYFEAYEDFQKLKKLLGVK